jgi:hypothetical protein
MSLKKKEDFFKMKKIVGILAVAAVFASSVFAANISARVVMEGSIAGGDKDKTSFWTLNEKEQKDADAMIVSVAGDNAGAQYQIWYKYDASGAAAVNTRNTNLWFKPHETLKITIGDFDIGTYKETIDWWKAGQGERADAHSPWSWSGFATVCGSGLNIEYTPIAGLWLNAGVTAKPGSSFATLSKENTYEAYGAGAKYQFADIPMSAALTWRDAGKGKEKILAIGADYGNNWAPGFYGFLNARLRFENISYSKINNAVTEPGKVQEKTWDCGQTLSAVVFDNYFKYALDNGLKFQLRAPVTLRMVSDMKDGDEVASKWGYSDPSWMSFELFVTYPVGAFTVYFDVENDNAITFDKAFADKVLNMNIKPGVQFSVGACALDVGFQVGLGEGAKAFSWSVPFLAQIAF